MTSLKTTRRRLVLATAVLALNMILAGVAFGQSFWTGNTSNGWFNAGNWMGAPPTPTSTSFMAIINTTSPNPTEIRGPAVAASILIGSSSGTEGMLTVTAGGTLDVSGTIGIRTGTLDIDPGSSVTAGTVFIGADASRSTDSGVATVNVTGPGASLVVGTMVVGEGEGNGTLNITSGGTVTSNSNLIIGNAVGTPTELTGPQGTGTVVVNDGTLSVNSTITVGQYGHGTLTVQNGGVVNAPGGIYVATIGITATGQSATGTINIGAPPGETPEAPGTLNTPDVHLQNGIAEDVTEVTPSTLNFNHTSAAYVFTPTITGGGPTLPNIGVVNQLAGVTILTGQNSYGGQTNILGGTLAVGVPLGSGLTTSTAMGTSNVSVTGGMLRTTSLFPAGSVTGADTGKPLTISVGGDYTQTSGGTLLLGIGGLNLSQFDHVVVTGNAFLDATLEVRSLSNFHPSAGDEFLVLHTGGTVTGNFGTLDESTFNTEPGVEPGHLELRSIEVEAKNGVVLVYVAVPPDQELPDNGTGDEHPIIIDDNQDLPAELEAVQLVDPTAEELTALYEITFSGATMQRFMLGDRMFQIQQGSTGFVSQIAPVPSTTKENEGKGEEGKKELPPAYQPGPENRWGIWMSGSGDFVSLSSTNEALGYTFTTGNLSVGVDYRITEHLAVGIFGAYSHTRADLEPSGSIGVNTGRGGLYATYFNQGWYVDTAIWGGGSSYSTTRQAILGSANGDTNGSEFSTYGETGYIAHFGNLGVGPLVSLQYTDANIDGFNENGSLIPLDIHGGSEHSLNLNLGGQAFYKVLLWNMPVIPTLELAWSHEFLYSALAVGATAPALDNATGTFVGPAEGHDSLIINANVLFQINPRLSLTVGYVGNLARTNYNSNAVVGTIGFNF